MAVKPQDIKRRLAMKRDGTVKVTERTTPARVNGKFVKRDPGGATPQAAASVVDSRTALGDDVTLPPTSPAEPAQEAAEALQGDTPTPDIGDTGGAPPQAKVRKESAKRKRGRPRKEDAQTVHSDAAPRARSNKPGNSSAMYAGTLLFIHGAIATVTRTPEFALAGNEAEALGGALDAVAREFGVVVSSKTQAVVALISTMAMIYPQRFAAVAQRRKAARAAAPPKPTNGAGQPHGENAPDWNAVIAGAGIPPAVGGPQ